MNSTSPHKLLHKLLIWAISCFIFLIILFTRLQLSHFQMMDLPLLTNDPKCNLNLGQYIIRIVDSTPANTLIGLLNCSDVQGNVTFQVNSSQNVQGVYNNNDQNNCASNQYVFHYILKNTLSGKNSEVIWCFVFGYCYFN